MKIKNFLIMFLAVSSCFSFVGPVFGGGFDNTALGMRGMSMGNALTGAVDDASAVYFNPAGLAFNEKDIWYSSGYAYFTHATFKYKANSIEDESNPIFIVPGFFLSRTFENWAFGYGFYVPYAGGGTEYQQFQNTPYDYEASAAFIAITLAAARKLSPKLSLGASASLYYGTMEQDFFNTDIGARTVSDYDGLAGYGGYIGLMYQISEEWCAGLVARSAVPIDLDGTEKIGGIKYDSEIEMTFPYSFDLGVGYQPNPKLTLAMALSYRLWSDMDEITVRIEGLPKNEIDTHYRNSWLVGIGMEYRVGSDLAFKAGLKYVQGATSDKGLNPGTLDIDLWNPTVGLAYSMSESTELNASVMFTYGPREEYHGQTFEQGHWSLILGARFKLYPDAGKNPPAKTVSLAQSQKLPF